MGEPAVVETTQRTNDGIDESRFHGSLSYVAEDRSPDDGKETQGKTDDRARDGKGQFVKQDESDQHGGNLKKPKESKLPESIRPPKPKDPADINGRFHDLSRSHDDLRRELQQAKQELQALREPKPEIRKPEPPKTYSGKTKPKADDFQSYDAYTEALTDWKIEEREASQNARQIQTDAQRTHTEREQKFFAHAAPIIQEIPDFEYIIRNPNLAMSEAMYHSIMQLGEIGPYAALHLAIHQDEARKLYHLSPEETFLQIGRMAHRLEMEIRDLKENTEAGGGRIATTPTPVKTRTIPDIKGTTPASGDLDQEPQDSDDMDTWRAKENNRMSRKYPGQRFFK